MTEKRVMRLTVVNPSKLVRGSLPYATFDVEGGVIGSGKFADWRLLNYENTISDRHCEIIFHNGRFCLIDRSGFIVVNNANAPMKKNAAIALNHNDFMKIGDYVIRAEEFGNKENLDILGSLESILGIDSTNLLISENKTNLELNQSLEMPHSLLLPKSEILDPLPLFQDESMPEETVQLIPNDNYGLSNNLVVASDSSRTNTASVTQILIDKNKVFRNEKTFDME